MFVEIHTLTKDGQDSLAGVLRLQDGTITADPDSRTLSAILAMPIYDPRAGVVWDAETDPEEFLRALRFQYSSAYLRAGEAQEERP